MDLAAHGPDTYVGTGPGYPWGGLYGGQIVAQALRAADLTVKAGYHPHSLHAYFLRFGDPEEPVRFEVERLRDGQTFAARQVVARQSTGAILNMSASFQVEGTQTMDVQLARAPDAGTPEESEDVSWSPLFELRVVRGPRGFDALRSPESARGPRALGGRKAPRKSVAPTGTASGAPSTRPKACRALAVGSGSRRTSARGRRCTRPPCPTRQTAARHGWSGNCTIVSAHPSSPGDLSAWTTLCGSTGPSGPTTGYCSRCRVDRCSTRVASPRAASFPGMAPWWPPSRRKYSSAAPRLAPPT